MIRRNNMHVMVLKEIQALAPHYEKKPNDRGLIAQLKLLNYMHSCLVGNEDAEPFFRRMKEYHTLRGQFFDRSAAKHAAQELSYLVENFLTLQDTLEYDRVGRINASL